MNVNEKKKIKNLGTLGLIGLRCCIFVKKLNEN